MIKLTVNLYKNKTGVVYVNPASIVYFQRTVDNMNTEIELSTGTTLLVIESPSEILKRI